MPSKASSQKRVYGTVSCLMPRGSRFWAREQEPYELLLLREASFLILVRQIHPEGHSPGYTQGDTLTPTRIAFSIPYVNAISSGLVYGPLFASYPHDLQIHPSSGMGDEFEKVAHVGAPTVSLEVKLVGVDDASIEEGKDPVGEVYVRGPPAGALLGDGNPSGENWLPTGYRGKAQPNGCFKILPLNK